MANKRVSLFSFGKIMLKCGRVLSSQPPQTDLQSPSLHWAPLKHVVCLLKVYHSWVPDKQEHIVMQIVAIPRGLCWGWWRPLLGKTLSAVSCWGDIFIEQLEQTAFCILFYTVPKVLVPSISASLTHTHTYPRCLFLLTHSRRHQPSKGGESWMRHFRLWRKGTHILLFSPGPSLSKEYQDSSFAGCHELVLWSHFESFQE